MTIPVMIKVTILCAILCDNSIDRTCHKRKFVDLGFGDCQPEILIEKGEILLPFACLTHSQLETVTEPLSNLMLSIRIHRF